MGVACFQVDGEEGHQHQGVSVHEGGEKMAVLQEEVEEGGLQVDPLGVDELLFEGERVW